MSAHRMAAMVGLGFALVLAGAGPAFAGTATAPGQGNAANNCLTGGPRIALDRPVPVVDVLVISVRRSLG